MEKRLSLGLKEALNLTLERIKPLPIENVELIASVDHTAATDLYALVDSPSIDASMKDGYAVFTSARPWVKKSGRCLNRHPPDSVFEYSPASLEISHVSPSIFRLS